MMKDKDRIIIIFYTDIRNISKEDVGEYLDGISKNLAMMLDGSVKSIVVPVEADNKVECINPVLLNEEQYKKTEEKVKNLQEDFFKFLEKKND